MTGELVALDYDGSHKTTLNARGYSIHSHMPPGTASIAGLPEPRNGHIYANLRPATFSFYPVYDASSSMVYDVDTSNGVATLDG